MKRNIVLALATAALAIVPAAFGETSTLGVNIGPEASFASIDASPTLSHTGTDFASFTGTTNFTFKMRTTQSSGNGHITVTVAPFSGSSGLVIATDLAFTSTSAGIGTAYSTSAAASSTTAGAVLTFGADAHSVDAGDAGTAAWTLADRPSVKVGSYTAVATFTIDAA